jgi:autotransporter-associated beta strand protein
MKLSFRLRHYIFSTGVFAVLSVACLQSATVTWVGGGNATASPWDLPSTWSSGSLPGPDDDVVIGGTLLNNGATILGANGNLTLTATDSNPFSPTVRSITFDNSLNQFSPSGGLRLQNSVAPTIGTNQTITLSTAGIDAIKVLSGNATFFSRSFSSNANLQVNLGYSGLANFSVATGSTLVLAGANSAAPSVLTGTGGVIKTGGGTLQLDTTPNNFTGGFVITGGNVNFTNANRLGSEATLNPTAVVVNGGTLNFTATGNGTVTSNATRGYAFGTGNATINVVTPGIIYVINGVVSDVAGQSGSLTKTGPGSLRLSANNTFSGRTVILGGNLSLTNNLALQNSALDTSGPGLVLLGSLVTTPTFGGLRGSANIASVVATNYANVTSLTLNPASGQTVTYSGVLSDGAAGMTLTKSGLGTQILSGNNTYTGSTTVAAGTLELSGSQASPLSVSDGSTLRFTLNDGLSPVVSSTSSLTLSSNSTVAISGTPVASTTYTLYSASAITGTPVLAAPVAGYELVVESNALKLKPTAAADTTPPVITLNGSVSVPVSWGDTYTDLGATATDETAPATPTVFTTVTPGGSVNTAKPGVYTVTYNATDAAGNPATPVTRTVTVSIANPATVGADGLSPLMKYAFGANGPADHVQAPFLNSTATTLTLTAVVRTDDPAVVVSGEAVNDLNGTWGTGGTVTVTTAADQSNLPPNCARRIFSVDTTGASRKFLRLVVVGAF